MASASDLAGLPLFDGLDAEELEQVASLFDVKSVGEGTNLVNEGASGYSFFVMVEGGAAVVVGGETLATYAPGDFFGELAMFDGVRRTATITTTSPAKVLEMFGTDFRLLQQSHPDVAERIEDVTDRRRQELLDLAARTGGEAA